MIGSWSLAEVAQVIGADTISESGVIAGVSTDTRNLGDGDLFVALRGEHFDGHNFIGQASDAGAVAAVVDTVDSRVGLPQLKVKDTLAGLSAFAAANRDRSRAEFVAVTGSSGKTTVKEMLAAILGEEAPTLATQGNLNNHIGVPLTLLRIAQEHRYAVVEHGASGVGEIAQTIALTRPDVAIITNAAEAHLEGFGSYDNIVIAKGEIIDGVNSQGVVVLNQDDPAFPAWRKRAGDRRVVSVSARPGSGATYELASLELLPSGQRLTVIGPEGWRCELVLPLPGEHNALNAMLAIAAVRALRLADNAITRGLEGMKPVKGRLSQAEIATGLTLIDDSYNANPSSMKAALKVLAGRSGKRIAVLGAMAELGSDSDRLHQEVGEAAAKLGIEQLVVVGGGCEGYRTGFGTSAVACADHDTAVTYLMQQHNGPMTVLVKGSRSSAMERVAEGLKEKVTNSCCSG
ncbi:UDP-N-acetylmuramoyl-tripeptide--D-alanyl-D-alanine ligase [Marinobacter zhejiangensis]|uniref:UDP-N-acetylmuramoyl-tripeptide--D-alanyl-D-alanine ligase n=1 Tax=Marinobacter zhejiangensis TaxID=488535 RepID=A0A1I4TB24_9GAMM|nr:UDP-N-acetylmuramoyl-tripeptide--D-alanyl-D-alanine ligase [Marinobacter zhejiangensis]SFM73886.1 UDP-N-acetylmuramoyl-tripeptide--D-alanyl-D-alanine ligase [Marinobacter zhejiangensis]